MGRAPCCDKANVKKGPWSPEEDAKLKAYIDQFGTGGNWIALPQKIGLKRCGKSCRLRWLNYLRPNIKHGSFSEEEDNIICSLYISIGSRWSIIAAQLPGRTDNDIKNYWNTRLKKKLLGKQQREQARRIHTLKKDDDDDGKKNLNIMINHHNQASYLQNPNTSGQDLRDLIMKMGGKFCYSSDSSIQLNNNQMEINISQTHQNYNPLLFESSNLGQFSADCMQFGGVSNNLDQDPTAGIMLNEFGDPLLQNFEGFYGMGNSNLGEMSSLVYPQLQVQSLPQNYDNFITNNVAAFAESTHHCLL